MLEAWGIETIAADLLQPGALDRLARRENVIYMAARKFGSTGAEALTWAMNTFLPGLGGEALPRLANCRVLDGQHLSARCRWRRAARPKRRRSAPVGEYAQSALGRERMFEYFSSAHGTPITMLRLNYAIELRYGVLLDIGQKVFERRAGGSDDGARQRDLAG